MLTSVRLMALYTPTPFNSISNRSIMLMKEWSTLVGMTRLTGAIKIVSQVVT